MTDPTITVRRTAMPKCERCWRCVAEVNPRGLCDRCELAMQAWEETNGPHSSQADLTAAYSGSEA